MKVVRWLALAAGTIALLGVPGRGDPQPTHGWPDLIVSDLRADPKNLFLEVQNQGPGKFVPGLTVEAVVSWPRSMPRKDPNPPTVTVRVPVPAEVFATESVTIPFSKFGSRKASDPDLFFEVVLDPRHTLTEERKSNNSYYRQLYLDKNVIETPRGKYKAGGGLPDLVITDLTQENDYIVVHYMNQGKGSTGADFAIALKAGQRSFPGGSGGFQVPEPGVATKTGGLTLGVIGLRRGDVAVIEATIDPYDRVRETDKSNNTFKKKMRIK